VDTVRWFKDRAKAQLKARAHDGHNDATLQQVQHAIALESGFAHWKAMLDATEVERQLVVAMATEPGSSSPLR